MNSHYSILKFINNPLSGESISLGIIAYSGEKVFFKFSANKVNIANRLNPMAKKLVSFSLKQLDESIRLDSKDRSDEVIEYTKSINIDFIKRLADYNNGLIQFSEPSYVKKEIDQDFFNGLFSSYIDEPKVNQVIKKKSSLTAKVEKKLYAPLRDKINVDYTLKKKSINSLYLDFHFDSLGVNGALYGSKVIDFNEKRIHVIRHEIAEYESVIDRMKSFASEKSINGDHKFYIISDAYKGSTIDYVELYNLLENKDLMPHFELVDSRGINKIVDIIDEKKATKFSELL